MTTHYKWAGLCAAAVLLAGCAGTPAEPPVAGRAPVADAPAAAAAGHRIAGLALVSRSVNNFTPASGRNVSVADFGNEYYQQHLVGVGRLLAD